MENIKTIEKFSIWLVKLEDNPIGHEQGGKRPFFVISDTVYNENSGTPIGFIMSTSEKKSKNRFAIQVDNISHVNVSQIRTLDSSRFLSFKKNVDKEKSLEIIENFMKQIVNI